MQMWHLLFLNGCAAAAPPGSTFKITGLVAPVYSPFTASGELDLTLVRTQAVWLNATGVKWVFTAGSTGESVDLTVPERMALAVEWIKVAKEFDMRVIVHVGTDSIGDGYAMAKHAEDHGADVIAAMPPTYIKPSTVQALVETMAAIAAGAPSLPFYYYHIPILTGVYFDMSDFVAAADAGIPTLRGIKFTHEMLDDFQLASEYTFKNGPIWRKGLRPNMLYGRDQQLLGVLPYGCEGAVGTTYNFNAELAHHVFAAFKAGDLVTARAAQKGTARFVKILTDLAPKLEGAYMWKMVMDVAGMSMGPGRLPYTKPTAEVKAIFRSAIVGWCAELREQLQPSWCKKVMTTVHV